MDMPTIKIVFTLCLIYVAHKSEISDNTSAPKVAYTFHSRTKGFSPHWGLWPLSGGNFPKISTS